MPITVSGPDNITVSFPDGTDAAVINNVMMKHFGGGTAAPSKASPVTTGNLARAAAEGVPVIGGALNNLEAATNAFLAPYVDPVLPDSFEKLPEPTYGERYKHALDIQERKSSKFETEHPIAATAAELAGGAGATGLAGATRLGAWALGMGGRTLAEQAARGAISGGIINAADALMRSGGDIGTIAPAGIAGGAIGAAAPAAARVAGAVAAPVLKTVRGVINPQSEAALTTARTIDAGQRLAAETPGYSRNPLTPAEYQQAAAQGFPVTALDLAGQPGRDLARAAANISPEGSHILNQALDDRFASQSQRWADWFQGTLNYPTEAARNQAIRDVAENVYQPEYQKAYAASRTVQLWPDKDLIKARAASPLGPYSPQQLEALKDLAQAAQSPEVQAAIPLATLQLRSWANLSGLKPPAGAFAIDRSGPAPRTVLNTTSSGNAVLPSLQYWDYIKRALDQIGTPQAKMQAKILRDNLDLLVPEYAAARAAAQPVKFFGGARNAYEAGRNYIDKGGKFGADEAAQVARMTPQERDLFHDGYASALTERLLRSPDRANILNRVINSPAARQEAETALGPARLREIEARVRLEDIMHLGRQAVQGNSTSVRQLVQLGLAGGTGIIESGNPLNWDSETFLHAALAWGALHGRAQVNERVAKEIAKQLASPNPQQVQFGMRLLTHSNRLMNALRTGHQALARAAAAQFNQ